MLKCSAGLIFAGAVILIASFLVGGRYFAVAIPWGDVGGLVYVVDRFTGATAMCDRSGCAKISNAFGQSR